jgi:copper homeostasis protein
MRLELEICANSIQSALAAQQGGATRIELCDNMAEGGTTPSAGMIRECKRLLTIPFFPIIRPRGGDFLYSEEEVNVMKQDILFCKESGAEGVVIGILKADGSIDKERCRELMELARPMQVTFHRAFDRSIDLSAALEDIIALGCERVLTSGGQIAAADAIPQLIALVKQAAGRISILAGSGVNEENISQIAVRTAIKEFHSTAKEITFSAMEYKGDRRLSQQDGEFPIFETKAEKVFRMKEALEKVAKLR